MSMTIVPVVLCVTLYTLVVGVDHICSYLRGKRLSSVPLVLKNLYCQHVQSRVTYYHLFRLCHYHLLRLGREMNTPLRPGLSNEKIRS